MAEISSAFSGEVSFQSLMLFLFVVILTFILGSLLNVLIIKYLKQKTEPFVYKTLSKLVMYSIYAGGLYFAFSEIINFSIPTALTALGILGAATILTTGPILQNIAAGIVLAFERPFKEEDIIELNNSLCKVKDIMLRKTRLRSLDGKIITVPNLIFMTSASVINYSRGEFIRVTLNIDLNSSSDLGKVAEIIKGICHDSPNILPNVPEKKLDAIAKLIAMPRNFFTIPKNIKALTPKVMIKGVGKEKVSLEVWFWIWDITMKERIISSFYKKLINEFGKEEIKFG